MFGLKKVQSEIMQEPEDLLLLQQFAIKDHTNSVSVNTAKPAADVLNLKSPVKEPEKKDSLHKNSFIEENMIIIGPVSSATSIEIQGQVNGDVSCENDVIVSGAVSGNINAGNVRIASGKVTGNINSKNSVFIDKESSVKGNIISGYFKCDGKVEGDTILKTNAVVTKNAVIYGDISARQISVEQGVEIKGSLLISENNCGYDNAIDNNPEKENEDVLMLEEKKA